VRSNWKTDKQKGREENMGETKREILRNMKGISERETGVGCGTMIHEMFPPPLNPGTLQNATAQNGCCIL